MDLIITGRIGAALPALARGLDRARHSAPRSVSRSLLDRIDVAGPSPAAVARLAAGRLAGVGALGPPPPRTGTPPVRAGTDHTGRLAARARALLEGAPSEIPAGKGDAVERLRGALDLLDRAVREQQVLLSRGRQDLR